MLKRNNVSDIHYYDYMNIGDDDLLIEKKVNMQNTIIFTGAMLNNNYDYYHADMRLLKCFYKLAG